MRESAVQELVPRLERRPRNLAVAQRPRAFRRGLARASVAVLELVRGWKDDPETLPILKLAQSDEDPAVRRSAMQELVRGWKDDAETLPILKACAQSDESRAVRGTAMQELARGWKDDAETLPILKACARRPRAGLGQARCKNWLVAGKTTPRSCRGSKTAGEFPTSTRPCARRDAGTGPRLERRPPDDAVAQRPCAIPQALGRAPDRDAGTGSRLERRPRDLAASQRPLSIRRGIARARDAVQELARGWKVDPETLPWLKLRAS